VYARERLRERGRLGVDDEVDLALAVEQHVLRPVLGDGGEAHLLEQPAERRGIGRGVFDELEAVGAERVVPEVMGRRVRHGRLHGYVAARRKW
jgi:hypothetical protein